MQRNEILDLVAAAGYTITATGTRKLGADTLDSKRRNLFAAGAAFLLSGRAFAGQASGEKMSPPNTSNVTLLSAPIELAGDWAAMLPFAVDQVVERMRHCCLDGVRLVSDRQPTVLRVDEHTAGPPAVWLHPDGSSAAWIIVDIGQRAWSQLAYQFGHELGHVLANSWQRDAKPAKPCQWLEESIVESFSLRGLANLARDWQRTPPFAGDNAYGDAIFAYRQDIIGRYGKLAADQGAISDFGTWFGAHRSEIEAEGGLGPFAQAAALIILEQYDQTPGCIEAVGALNRWPGRSSVPIPEYLDAWETSCLELQASPALPSHLRKVLGIV